MRGIEYPRPDFIRGAWLGLCGYWQFAFDDDDVGLAREWFASGRTEPFDHRIMVPFVYQSRASGVGDTTCHPVVWYRRTFEVPASWTGKRILLHFGAVDYISEVWVNGKPCGRNVGGYVPFVFDVSRLVRPGTNEVVVRVIDEDFTWYPRGKQAAKREPWACWYHRMTGIWQPVWLEPVGPIYIHSVRLVPDLDARCLELGCTLNDCTAGLSLRVVVTYRGSEMATADATVEGEPSAFSDRPLPTTKVTVPISEVHCWSPETPELYDVLLELRRGTEVLDTVRTYFGMRKVHTEDGKFILNNRPYYLRMVLDQGFWPETLYTPPDVEAVRRDIELTKAMGFNGARKHQKIEDPYYYYFADQLGLAVWAEMPSAYDFREDALPRFYDEWARAVLRLRNHPCIVAWVPMNESWGVGQLGGPDSVLAAHHVHHLVSLYHFTKAVDGTRPVVSNDGWEHAETDLVTIHEYCQNGDELVARYRKYLEDRGAAAFSHQRLVHLPGHPYRGQPILVTEFGGVKLGVDEQGGWGYGRPATSGGELLERIRTLVRAVRSLEGVAGYCYTQLTDVEQEKNGLLTSGREPKLPLSHLASVFGA